MRADKTSPNNDRAERKHLLLCDPAGVICDRLSCDKACVNSPLQCLNQAVTDPPDIILICFDTLSLHRRDTLLELCAVLKMNRYTRDCLILALLNSKHRMVVDALQNVGVDFVKFFHSDILPSASLESIVESLEERDKPECNLGVLCRFLHYSEIDSQHEMTVCGAYLDRLVLAPGRLYDVCETDEHLHCEYFLKPRHKS